MKLKDYLITAKTADLNSVYKTLFAHDFDGDRAALIRGILEFFTEERKSELLATVSETDSFVITALYLGLATSGREIFGLLSVSYYEFRERISRLENRLLILKDPNLGRYELNDDLDYSTVLNTDIIYRKERRKNTHPKVAIAALLSQMRKYKFSSSGRLSGVRKLPREAFPLFSDEEYSVLTAAVTDFYKELRHSCVGYDSMPISEYYSLLNMREEALVTRVLCRGADPDVEKLFALAASGVKTSIISRLARNSVDINILNYLFLAPDYETDEKKDLVISADFTVRCSPIYAVSFTLFAELELLDEHYANFLITEKSVKDALSYGISPSLITEATKSAPESVRERVRRWAEDTERVKIYDNVLYLETDEYGGKLLSVHPAVKSYIYKQLSDTSFLIYRSDVAAFKKALSKAKLDTQPIITVGEQDENPVSLLPASSNEIHYGPVSSYSYKRDEEKFKEHRAALEQRALAVSKNKEELNRYKVLIEAGAIFDLSQITEKREFPPLLSAKAFDRQKQYFVLERLCLYRKYCHIKTTNAEFICLIMRIERRSNVSIFDMTTGTERIIYVRDIYYVEELETPPLKDDIQL